MAKTIIYIHGKGGNAEEAIHYKPLFGNCDVIGFDYESQTPWEAREEFPKFFDTVCRNAQPVEIIANSIGAFFSMNALTDKKISKAYFISPVVDMKKLISDMMLWANVTEDPVAWNVPTHILYGDRDSLTSYETISCFADQIGATLTVMKGGEHWFHTDNQMAFLDQWIKKYI